MLQVFADRLKELRAESGLSAMQLGKKLGISDAAIIRWENGNHVPSVIGVYKLAVFFNVSMDFLCGLEEYGTGDKKRKGEV